MIDLDKYIHEKVKQYCKENKFFINSFIEDAVKSKLSIVNNKNNKVLERWGVIEPNKNLNKISQN